MNALTRASLIVAMGLLLGTQAHAEVIYTEGFDDDTAPSDRAGLSNVGWYGHVNVPGDPPEYAKNFSDSTNDPIFQYNGSVGSYGYASLTNYDEVIAWTTEPGSVSTLLLESISFKVKNNIAEDFVRIAVRIGSDWFATDEAYGVTSSSFTLREFEWTTAAAAWRDLTFEPGTALSVASSARTSDLPSGSVDAFGLFIDPNATNAVRFDDFTISATVPEPSTLTLLLGLGGLFAMVAARRR